MQLQHVIFTGGGRKMNGSQSMRQSPLHSCGWEALTLAPPSNIVPSLPFSHSPIDTNRHFTPPLYRFLAPHRR